MNERPSLGSKRAALSETKMRCGLSQSEPGVTVIIPCYNAAEFLPEAVNSVADQSYREWHIVLVDDGSTDSTSQVMRELQNALGSRVSILTGDNRGACHARNWAISLAETEFVAFLDSDDVWHKDKLKMQMELLASNSGLLAASCAYSLSDSSLRKRTKTLSFAWTMSEMVNWTLLGSRTPAMNSTILVRRSVFEHAGVFDENLISYSEDLDLAWRLISVGPVGTVDMNLATIRLSAGQTHRHFGQMVSASRILYQKFEITRPRLSRIASANLTLYSLLRQSMTGRRPTLRLMALVWAIFRHPVVAVRYLGRRARDFNRLQLR